MDAESGIKRNWRTWGAFLRQHRLDGLVAWLLEALGPFTLLFAQFLYIGSPFLRPTVFGTQLDALADLLEDPQEVNAFVAFLKETGTG